MFHDVTNWFCLVVGAACLLQPLVLRVVSRWHDSEWLRLRRRSWPMIACLGVMLTVGSAVRMCGWTGIGLAAAFGTTMIFAVAAIVFAIRALADRAP